MKRKLLISLMLIVLITSCFNYNCYASVYNNRWDIELSKEEINLLAKIVWLEAGNQEYEGQVAVVETIFNRMYSNLYPNTLEEVLSQPHQFGTWHKRDIAKPTYQCYYAIHKTLYGDTNILEYDRLYFNNEPIGYSPIKIDDQYFGSQNKKDK